MKDAIESIQKHFRRLGAEVSISLSVHRTTDGKRPSRRYAKWAAEHVQSIIGGEQNEWQNEIAGVSVRNENVSFCAFYEPSKGDVEYEEQRESLPVL